MKILSIIGTRPQYVKIKPIFDFCNQNNINHVLVDTNQHYSENVSDYFIKEFSLKIDYDLDIQNTNELFFISKSIEKFTDIIDSEKPDFVLIYGDTNSTLVGSLVCYKKNIPFAHVEAGLRCGNIKVPEELNRIVSDITSQLQFTPIKNKLNLLTNEVVCGDLEYELLNNYHNKEITFNYPPVMTIHRKQNLNKKSFSLIMDFCKQYGETINFFIHHSTNTFIEKNGIVLPDNIKIKPPAKYGEMINELLNCKFIITDSGGLMKTSPFFGKKCIVMRNEIEWTDVEKSGYGKRYHLLKNPISWVLNNDLKREKTFYMKNGNPSAIIMNTIKKFIDDSKT